MGRLIYLDNLRSVLSVLVVGHHSALAASGLGRWYSSFGSRNEKIASAFVATALFTSQAFLTGTLFAVAGLLVPKSLAKKGLSKHFISRLWRLGLPVLLVGLPIHHLSEWLGQKQQNQSVENQWKSLGSGGILSFFQSGPGVAWFELWLLGFESIFLVLRGWTRFLIPKNLGFLKVFSVLLAVALTQYLVEMHVAKPVAGLVPEWKGLAHHIIHTPLYFFCFLCGIVSDTTPLLSMLGAHSKILKIACGFAMTLCFFFALGRVTSAEPEPERAADSSAVAIGAIMTVTICAGVSTGVMQSFEARYSRKSIFSGLSCLSYAVNLLHPAIVVILTPFVVALPLGLLAHWILLWVASVLASFAAAALVYRSHLQKIL